MNNYYYKVNVFDGDKAVPISGNIEAESAYIAIQKLIDDGIMDKEGYEFLELRKI